MYQRTHVYKQLIPEVTYPTDESHSRHFSSSQPNLSGSSNAHNSLVVSQLDFCICEAAASLLFIKINEVSVWKDRRLAAC